MRLRMARPCNHGSLQYTWRGLGPSPIRQDFRSHSIAPAMGAQVVAALDAGRNNEAGSFAVRSFAQSFLAKRPRLPVDRRSPVRGQRLLDSTDNSSLRQTDRRWPKGACRGWLRRTNLARASPAMPEEATAEQHTKAHILTTLA